MRINIQNLKVPGRPCQNRGCRRGFLAVELLLVLPILLALFLGMMQFSLILAARQSLLAASREGARVASHGATQEEVEATVKRVLGTGKLGDARVRLNAVHEDPLHPLDGRDRVEVCVCVPTTHVVPDMLRWIGISFRDQDLVAGTVMLRE
jgi:TadE-like protein